jgi:hypothetical protein
VNDERPIIDEAWVYALILDGSERALTVLSRMAEVESGCTGSSGTIVGDTLESARTLSSEANRIGRKLTLEPNSLESVIRTAAFFVPPSRRKNINVKLLARNSTGDRLLLEVSYGCGRLCGYGYYVVLHKLGEGWEYSLIRMAWIS